MANNFAPLTILGSSKTSNNKNPTILSCLFKTSLCLDEPVYIPSGTRRKSVFAEVLSSNFVILQLRWLFLSFMLVDLKTHGRTCS